MPYNPNSPLSAGQRAALEVLGVLPRLGATSPAPEAGGAPQRAAPAAAEMIDWDAVVAAENARLGLRAAATGGPAAAVHTQSHPDQRAAVIDWGSVVDAVNAEAGFTNRGANVDPRLAAMFTGSSAR